MAGDDDDRTLVSIGVARDGSLSPAFRRGSPGADALIGQAWLFEQQMAKVQALVNTTPEQLDALRERCLDGATRRASFDPWELAEVAHIGISAGLDVDHVTELLADHHLGVTRVHAAIMGLNMELPPPVPWWRRWRSRASWSLWRFGWKVRHLGRALRRHIRQVWL